MTEPADVAQTRAAYDLVAEDYADLLRGLLAESPEDLAMLSAFAHHVLVGGGGAVADLGCGPGRIAAHLAAVGVDVFGIDLSPAMIKVARRDHPAIRFDVASMTDLPVADGALAGAVAWYSIIHTPEERQARLFEEFARVVRPGGWLLLAFQVGDEVVHLTHAYGHDVDLDTRRQRPERVRERLEAAGFEVFAELVRRPVPPEKSDQAYVLAQRR